MCMNIYSLMGSMAILYCMKKVERYVRHKRFTVRTDHRNLVFMWKAASPKVTRWRLLLSEFDYTVEHIAGVENGAADGLSRLLAISLSHKQLFDKYHLLVGTHLTVNKTVQHLRAADHLWPNMRQEIKAWVSQCPVCQKASPQSGPDRPILTLPPSQSPLYEVHVDTMGPYPVYEGLRYILVIVDRFSRLTELVAIPDTKAETAAQTFINKWCLRYGTPARIQTDGGSQFRNSFFKTLEKLWEHHVTTPHRHQANAVVERMNREVGKWLKRRRISIMELDNWPLHLAAVQYIINASRSSISGLSPMQIVFGRNFLVEEPSLLLDAATEKDHSESANAIRDLVRYNVAISRAAQDTAEKSKRSEIPAPHNNRTPRWVLVRYPERAPSKLISPYRGPMRVHETIQSGGHTVAFIVSDAWSSDNPRHLKVDASRVRYFAQGNLSDEQVVALASTDVHEYGVDRITDKRSGPNGTEYLVEWTGYEPEEATWEPADALQDVQALSEFLAQANSGR